MTLSRGFRDLFLACPIDLESASFYPPRMTYEQVKRHFGSQGAIARALGIRQASVAGWKQAARVPHGRQYELQVLTGGVLKADGKHVEEFRIDRRKKPRA
jgi:hypothetical protein